MESKNELGIDERIALYHQLKRDSPPRGVPWCALVSGRADRSVVEKGDIVLRLLITLLVFTLGTPAISWAGTSQANGIEWLGAACCDESSDVDSEQARLENACCCRPTPISKRDSEPQFLLPSAADSLVYLSQVYSIVQTISASFTQVRHAAGGARAPPSQSLLAQHTLLLI